MERTLKVHFLLWTSLISCQLRLFLRCKHLNLHIDGIIKHYQTSLTTISSMLMIFTVIKPRPNDRNMPTQHVATLLGATCCVRLATVLQHVGCCWLKFETSQTWANNTQHVATHRNTVAKRTQHVAPNNVAICCVGMLRSFGRGLTPIILLWCLLRPTICQYWCQHKMPSSSLEFPPGL